MLKYLTIGALALGLSGVVNAATVQTKFVSYKDTAFVKQVAVTGMPGDSSFRSISLGSFNINAGGEQKTAFCVDPFQAESPNYHAYTVGTLTSGNFTNNGATRLARVKNLYNNVYHTLRNDAVKTAAFHYALWEVFHDNLDPTTGIVRFRAQRTHSQSLSVFNIAQSYIGQSFTAFTGRDKYILNFYQNNEHQDYLVALTKPVSSVPVPAALPLFATALAGFGVMRRRKSQAA